MKVADRTQRRADRAFFTAHAHYRRFKQATLRPVSFRSVPPELTELFDQLQHRNGQAYHYVLDGKIARPAQSFEEFNDQLEGWFKSEGTGAWRVAETELPGGGRISTVFLGINHQGFDGPPMIFETMAFLADEGQEQIRYSTWEEAEAGHKDAVERHTHASNAVRKLKGEE